MSSPVVTRRGAQRAKIQTRGVVKEYQLQEQQRKPNAALLEAKRKAKEKLLNKSPFSGGCSSDTSIVKDIYQTAMDSIKLLKGNTGLVFDERMALHRCLWDADYPECPERFTRVIERCEDLELIDRCQRIDSRLGTVDEILLKHTQHQYDLLKSTDGSQDEEKLEDLSSRYDAVYIHPSTFNLSLLCVGSTIELIENIVKNRVQNGMAVIRPPGHHAMKAEFNGYCFFNNVAIAAQHALDTLDVKRILIVDWDVHHGQASQRMFYNDPRVIYFSIHRYEHGTFWPNLRESDYDFIGEGEGLGYNFNLPLNKIGMTNADYLAIWQQILLPVAFEFQPELVIVSAGYDAAYGCPEFNPELVIVSAGFDSALGDEKGEMEVTPACYSHLLAPLMSLAGGKVAVVLEGGYCLQSLSEGAALTLRTLLGDPCPSFVDPLAEPCESIIETIMNCIYTHAKYWNSLQTYETYGLDELNNVNPQSNLHKVIQWYKYIPENPLPERFLTRNSYTVQTNDVKDKFNERLIKLKIATNLTVPSTRVCYAYDEIMLEHKNLYEDHPERPERIQQIIERYQEYGLLEKLQKIQSRLATIDELMVAHTEEHVNLIKKTEEQNELREIGEKFNSVYFHPKTFQCAALAVGTVLAVVDEVLNGNSRSGVCVIRPPGHHAESDLPHGFCIFNNVSVAANYAIRDHGIKRVLIIDWDVHHGNGTQHIFQSSPNVLYISVHRYDYGNFFPKTTDADYTVVGDGLGEGFNVNIPWNKKGMGDMEYILAFQRIIMPIAYEFDPELVLVSAGFDAAIGDPLGGCKVTPEAFGVFTQWLSSLANGRVILCLEGGYNVNTVSYAMTMCTKALLGDPMPQLQNTQKVQASCIETIQNVLSVQQKYWKSLRFNKKLPNFELSLPIDALTNAMANINLITAGNSDKNTTNTSDNKPSRSSSNDQQEIAGPSTSSGGGGGGVTSHQTLSGYLSQLQNEVDEEMYAIYPKTDCPHLAELPTDSPIKSIDTKQSCLECDNKQENWLCLHCNTVHCGRYVNEHMLNHYLTSEHPLILSYADLSVWCYKCDSYIDNSILYKYKNMAHLDKFGEEMVWSYGGSTVNTIDLA